MAKAAVWYYDKIKVTGLRDLRSTLRKADIKGKALKPAYHEASAFAADVARAAVPVKTGKLKASIVPKPLTNMARIQMGAGVKYTFLSELGGGAHWRSRVYRPQKTGQRGRSLKGGDRGFRPIFIRGAFRMAARLYIFQKEHIPNSGDFDGYHVLPAIRGKVDEITSVFMKAIDKLLEELL